MRKMMQNLQQEIHPDATTHRRRQRAGRHGTPVGRDEGLTVLRPTTACWRRTCCGSTGRCQHMVTRGVEFVVQLAAVVRAQGGLWLWATGI